LYITTQLVSCRLSPFTHWSIKNRHSMDNSLFPIYLYAYT
uniref:Ovule protein n=1 Tax=Haemonchus placei TaxID=6290 RepID=A0A0N4WTK7_HAEPC